MAEITRPKMTREQVDAAHRELMERMRAAGRAIGEKTVSAEQRQALEDRPAEFHDMRVRVSLMIDRAAWAEYVLMLDGCDALADCDRSDLVAEAIFLKATD
ncbi:hypothetical protein [Miltoncostaea oceani]|uniref:hypothetical protein n=1 Tax=Miltoncostaea oceani TaxID=2843216 RepID=UPI001C3E0C15|nr:hypothetical protein [Miltoncostaea oceani]